MRFDELGLRPELMRALGDMGYEELTPIQEVTFKPIMEGRDIIGLAETGSGKTSACGVPLVQEIDCDLNAIQVLVLVPTRELALQYVEEIDRLSNHSGISCFAIFGGFPMAIQEAKLRHGVDMLVATPGRLKDCIYNSQSLLLTQVKTVILDEADEMLDQGFLQDVQFILSCVMNKHQTLLFSATMPPEIKRLVKTFLSDPLLIELNNDQIAPRSLEHVFCKINPHQRTEELLGYLKRTETGQVIIFCNTRNSACDLYRSIRSKLKDTEIIHGGLEQHIRTSIFTRFKSGRIKHMIATDVAGRGLDFSKVTHVVNFEMPKALVNYTHRTGRTGRMGRKGTAVTLVTPRDMGRLEQLFRENRIEPIWLGERPVLESPESGTGGHSGERRHRPRSRPRGRRGPKKSGGNAS